MRLFLAIELSPSVLDAIAARLRSLRGQCEGWGWVRAESIHLTVRFLGVVEESLHQSSRPGWRDAAARSNRFDLATEELGCFPARGAARVLWLGVSDRPRGRLTKLAGRVETAAVDAGFAAEKRRFRPHLTLARSRTGASPPRAGWGSDAQGSMRVERLSLIESELLPSGARYRVVERYPVGVGAS